MAIFLESRRPQICCIQQIFQHFILITRRGQGATCPKLPRVTCHEAVMFRLRWPPGPGLPPCPAPAAWPSWAARSSGLQVREDPRRKNILMLLKIFICCVSVALLLCPLRYSVWRGVAPCFQINLHSAVDHCEQVNTVFLVRRCCLLLLPLL